MLCKSVILDELRKREPLFGEWRITSFIGAGAFGCVFKLERHDLGQTFVSALKIIPLSQEIDRQNRSLDSLKESLGREAREVLHLYRLSGHTNVVGWHNHQVFLKEEEDAVTAYIAVMMDYLPDSLSKELRNGPLPPKRALDILADCLRGLEHIHAHDIIHRDIKPENIFLAEHGTAKIGDFGIARQISDTTKARTVTGTPMYMAPEVYKDPLGGGYGFAADIYSLALVAYEMFEGHLPFEDDSSTTQSMVQRRLSGEPFTFSKPVPQSVRNLMAKALAFDARERFATAREFRMALERLQSGLLTANAAEAAREPAAENPAYAAAAALGREHETIALDRSGSMETAFMDADATRIMDADATQFMDSDETQFMDATQTRIMDPADLPHAGDEEAGDRDEPPSRETPGLGDTENYSFKAAELSQSRARLHPRRLVRLMEADKATEFVYFSRDVCKRFIELGREMIAHKGYIPVELGNKHSLHQDESLICGGLVALGLLESMVMGELEVFPEHLYEVESLLDTENYRLFPKYLGLHLNRGENQYVRAVNLKLIGFTLNEPEF